MCQVSFAEPGLLSSARDTKVASTGLSRDVPAGTCGFSAGRRSVRRFRRGGRRGRGADLGVQRLQHAGGFLAARHAQVQPLFFLAEQRIRIVLAVVAALAAVLLAHRRHHAAGQRPALGELHALGERHGLVVPGRAVVLLGRAADLDARHQGRSASCGDSAVASPSSRPAKNPFSQTRCSAVNGALSGTMEDERRAHRRIHGAASANIAVSAGISWRRVNAWKLSSREARRAR